ncbi:hypothetical protein E1176_06655 [Fulvivirga sp. RKSG066]|uniref:hypothetical protein n=1 Tax=Fulvivirga aurantia TaxID=2529383 RepID=UPI001CA3BAB7|nr:hypothetical protein [Fulvivirga aurantia]MTI20696.1 hypothetical protein [Fulvivirga aurantia]
MRVTILFCLVLLVFLGDYCLGQSNRRSFDTLIAYKIDGSITYGEIRDTSEFKYQLKHPHYIVKQNDVHTYLAVRSNSGTIMNAYILRHDGLKVFHASAALGQVAYVGSGDTLMTSVKEFDWVFRDSTVWSEPHPEGVASLEAFFKRFGWVANVWSMGSYREYEKLLDNTLLSDEARLLVSFASMDDDIWEVKFYENGKQISLTGDAEIDKQVHNGYITQKIKIER